MPVNCWACDYLFIEGDSSEGLPECPKCGSSGKVMHPSGQEARLQAGLCITSSPPSGGRWECKSETKHSYYKKDDEHHFIDRTIDRANNHYYERIINKETGEVVREVDERLTEHQGRGSAKHKKKI